MEKILIAGGTGFVGRALTRQLIDSGYSINLLTRRNQTVGTAEIQYFTWDIEKSLIDERAFDGVTHIINLTGANISEKRWTEKRKTEIMDSRIRSLDLLYAYAKNYATGIRTFVSSSATGYYGAVTSDKIFTEIDANGSDFLAAVCRKWEKSVRQFEDAGIDTVILRKGVVIGKEGGMYQKLAPLARLGINTSLGNGKQYLPWIDIRDLVRLYEFILRSDGIRGVFNAVASEHVTMNGFSQALLQSFNKTSFLPNVPEFLVKLMFGEMSSMLLRGSRVSNHKINEIGFRCHYDTLALAFL